MSITRNRFCSFFTRLYTPDRSKVCPVNSVSILAISGNLPATTITIAITITITSWQCLATCLRGSTMQALHLPAQMSISWSCPFQYSSTFGEIQPESAKFQTYLSAFIDYLSPAVLLELLLRNRMATVLSQCSGYNTASVRIHFCVNEERAIHIPDHI